MPARKNLTGLKFGRLTIIKISESKKLTGKVIWDCICDCGKTATAQSAHLLDGRRVSCGCAKVKGKQLKVKQPVHGHCSNNKNSNTYQSWTGMKDRCYNPKSNNYHNYGGRGIIVCDRWLNSFQTFLADMGEKPEGYSIERVDVNGNYCPENCKWIPKNKQQRNTRKSIRYNGENIAELCEQLKLDYNLVKERMAIGWDFEKAAYTPRMTRTEIARLVNAKRWGNR